MQAKFRQFIARGCLQTFNRRFVMRVIWCTSVSSFIGKLVPVVVYKLVIHVC